jgi:hypothetical protein
MVVDPVPKRLSYVPQWYSRVCIEYVYRHKVPHSSLSGCGD